jgi:hypothetical protein
MASFRKKKLKIKNLKKKKTISVNFFSGEKSAPPPQTFWPAAGGKFFWDIWKNTEFSGPPMILTPGFPPSFFTSPPPPTPYRGFFPIENFFSDKLLLVCVICTPSMTRRFDKSLQYKIKKHMKKYMYSTASVAFYMSKWKQSK